MSTEFFDFQSIGICPNGAGKSTCFKLLAKFLAATTGQNIFN